MTTVLFVCTGNTCRSPMAACLFNAMAKEAGQNELSAVSAGLCALSNDGASSGAQRAMEERGLSLKQHRTQSVTQRLLLDVSLVVCVSKSHAAALKARFPAVHVPIRAFDPPIPDPFQGDDAAYRTAAAAMEPQIQTLFAQLSK